MIPLSVLTSCFGKDPDVTATMEFGNRDVPVDGHGKPNRLTLHVPTENTVLSLGEKAAKEAKHRINDPGITGRTDTHVHWHVYGVAGTPQTLVSLGAPAKDVTQHHWNADAMSGTGYGMFTEGRAWHESKWQHYFTSRDSDIIMRTRADATAVVQSDLGNVEIVAKKDATVAAGKSVSIAAQGIDVEDTGYGLKRKTTAIGGTAAKTVKLLVTLGDVVASIDSLLKTLSLTSQSPEENKAAWKTESKVKDNLKLTLDQAKLISTVLRENDSWMSASPLGRVSIYATGYSSIVGNIAASMFGVASASVSSVLSASVLGATASVKGLLYTSIWAYKEASLKAKKDVKIEAETGELSAKSEGKAVLASTKKAVIVQGHDDTRVSSTDKAAIVHGKTSAFVGAGDKAGFGLMADDKKFIAGEITSGGNEFKPKFNGKQKIQLMGGKTKTLSITVDDSSIGIAKNKVTLKANHSMTLSAFKQNIIVNGKKVLLG
jgi:hypothetical protein